MENRPLIPREYVTYAFISITWPERNMLIRSQDLAGTHDPLTRPAMPAFEEWRYDSHSWSSICPSLPCWGGPGAGGRWDRGRARGSRTSRGWRGWAHFSGPRDTPWQGLGCPKGQGVASQGKARRCRRCLLQNRPICRDRSRLSTLGNESASIGSAWIIWGMVTRANSNQLQIGTQLLISVVPEVKDCAS